MKDIGRALESFVRQISQLTKFDAEVIRDRLPSSLSSRQNDKSFSKTLLSLSVRCRKRNRLRGLRGSLAVGTVLLGPRFLARAERAGLLLSNGVPHFSHFLSEFAKALTDATDEGLILLKDRVVTYLVYHQLAVKVRRDQVVGEALLRKRPRRVIKGLLALTNLYFLRDKLGLEFGDRFAEYFAEFKNPEDMAKVTSLLLAAANESHPLDSLDFASPLSEDMVDPKVVALSSYGRDLLLEHETGKLISLFGYRLEVAREGEPTVFYLRPPSAEFEYFLRLALMRDELDALPFVRPFLGANPPFAIPKTSLFAAASFFEDQFSKNVSRVVDRRTPYERIQFYFPTEPELYRWIATSAFYEDALALDRLVGQFLWPFHGGVKGDSLLTEHLSLQDF